MNTTTETPTYIVSADTIDMVCDAADWTTIVEERTPAAARRFVVDAIADAVESYLSRTGREGIVERIYESTVRRDSDDCDTRVWDAVLVDGVDALRSELGLD